MLFIVPDENSLKAYGGNTGCRGYLFHGFMQLLGKGVCSVYQQFYTVLDAKCFHFFCIHGTLQTDTVVQKHFLFVSFGGVIEWFSSLLKSFDSDASFGGSAKY